MLLWGWQVIDMTDRKFEAILQDIARKHHTTPERVRQEMQAAMDVAMASPDPAVQARWAAIPRKGEKLSLEEFVRYMASLSSKSFS